MQQIKLKCGDFESPWLDADKVSYDRRNIPQIVNIRFTANPSYGPYRARVEIYDLDRKLRNGDVVRVKNGNLPYYDWGQLAVVTSEDTKRSLYNLSVTELVAAND